MSILPMPWLPAMTLSFDTGGMNFHYANVTSTTPAAGPTPYSGSPAAVPGTIDAERFDNGAEGVAYYDTTPGNSGPWPGS